jgi:DNA-binding NarL/FixJ family response regulator
LVIGHHVVLLDGLRQFLEPEFEVRTSDADLHAALTAAAMFRPDAAIIDSDAGDISLGICRQLCEARPGIAVIYLTSDIDPPECPTAFSKTRPASDLLRVVRTAVYPPAETWNGVEDQSPAQNEVRAAAILSDREREVLARLVQGLTMKEVARELGIAPRTVAFHKYRAMEVNGLRNNADLMAFALRHGLLAAGRRPHS